MITVINMNIKQHKMTISNKYFLKKLSMLSFFGPGESIIYYFIYKKVGVCNIFIYVYMYVYIRRGRENIFYKKNYQIKFFKHHVNSKKFRYNYY